MMIAWIALWFGTCWSALALAHVGGSTGLATIVVRGHTVQYSVELSLGALPAQLADAMHLGDAARTPDLLPLVTAVMSHVHVRSQGAACEPVPADPAPSRDATGAVVLVVRYACAEPPGRLVIEDDLCDVLGKDHHTLAGITYPGSSRQVVFQPDARSVSLDVEGTVARDRRPGFFALGIEHILSGYDHLLFLLALIVAGGNLWSLLKIITAFTLAHSITLALAAFNVVVLPERLVESAIAASIAFVAAENLLASRPASHRWAVSFFFGLVHGFGFAAVLQRLGLTRSGLAWSLLSFNLGVEAAQAGVVVLALPLLIWVRRFRWQSRALAAVSIVILVVGIGLLLERGILV